MQGLVESWTEKTYDDTGAHTWTQSLRKKAELCLRNRQLRQESHRLSCKDRSLSPSTLIGSQLLTIVDDSNKRVADHVSVVDYPDENTKVPIENDK